MEPGRTTHTFVFADLAGFTALTEAHGDELAADLAADFCRRLAGMARDHGGEVIKNIGDAVMIRCEAAEAAVNLALGIVDEEQARPLSPTVRVGMHSGTAVEREGDWFGSTVNLAARVSGAARGQEVLLTEQTRALAVSLKDVDLELLGPREFRNVAEAVVVYRAQRVGRSGTGAVIDPVCRMAVSEDETVGSLRHGGVMYRFCSLACAARFAVDPERVIGRSRKA